MAVLKKPVSSMNGPWDLSSEDLAPEGTWNATCLDIHDQFGVERKKYQSEDLEKVDLTYFLFGFRDQHNKPHKIATIGMKISGSEKSKLYEFLLSWLGQAPDVAGGWDYGKKADEGGMKGRKAMITVAHVARRSGAGSFATIAAVTPVPPGYTGVGGPRNAPAAAASAIPSAPVITPAPAVVEEDVIPF